MKIKDIELTNFANYDKVSVSFDPNLTYVIGRTGSGKTTLCLSGIHFMFQGIAEKATEGKTPLIGERFRFIGPNAATSKGIMTLYDEKKGIEVKVMRKLTKTGTELSFMGPEGMVLDQQWLNDLFNVFLIAPKRFCELSPKEQAKALGINTRPFDDAVTGLKSEYTQINAIYRSFGELVEPEKAEKVDVKILEERKAIIREGMVKDYRANQATNAAIRKAWEDEKAKMDEEVRLFNEAQVSQKKYLERMESYQKRIASILSESEGLDTLVDLSKLTAFIELIEHPKPPKFATELYPKEPTNLNFRDADYMPKEGEQVYIKEVPDETALQEIDKEISDASETNRKALLYEQWQEKVKQKEDKKKELDANMQKQKDKETERVAYVKAFPFPFSNLAVDEEGQLLLQGKPIKEPYFSSGEILKIVPILLSTANPDLKYVFLQDFSLMDDEKQAEIEKYLTDRGFQLVVELVGKAPIADKNCILLKDNVVVESYEQEKAPKLL